MKLKANKLNQGDQVLALSLSWGGPGLIPDRYAIGKGQLEKEFGVKVIEGKYTLKDPQRLYDHPEARAEDLLLGFANKDINAIISTIGGDESIRILPYIDYSIIKNNPKIFMGYSDSTVTHFICNKANITSFYGPAIMAGFGENGGLFPYMIQSVRKTLFSNHVIGEIYPNNQGRTSEFIPWKKRNQNIKRKIKLSTGRRWIQGMGIVEGILLGGCIDVFPFIIGTDIRPKTEERKDKILCIETSEEKMSTIQFERILRNLGSQGILHNICGILVGRVQYDYQNNTQINYDEVLLKIVSKELGLNQLPIITNMDFGHTDPMFVLPFGCKAIIDCMQKKFIIAENACL